MLYHQEAVVRPQNSFQSRMEQSLLCRYMKYFDSLGATAVAEWVAAAMTEWVATVVAAIELVVMAAGVCVLLRWSWWLQLWLQLCLRLWRSRQELKVNYIL